MEDNSPRIDMIKWPENLEELNVSHVKKEVKSNTFPLRIRKENEAQLCAFPGRKNLNKTFNLEIQGCAKRSEGIKSCVQKTVEDELIKSEDEVNGNVCECNDPKLLQYSSSFPNLEAAKDNCHVSRSTTNNVDCKNIENFRHTSPIAQRSKAGSHQNDELIRSVLNTVAPSSTNSETESYSSDINVNNSVDQSTSSREIIACNLQELRPLRPNRIANSRTNVPYRPEVPPTQIQISPINNMSLSNNVDGILGIFDQFKAYRPTIGSAVFSILMTIIFVGILWIVVFTIFGPKGHAIAGIFLSIFILGFLLNTCFLKIYFRLRLFFGVEQLREQTIRDQHLANLEQHRQEELRQQRAMEPPPSYLSVMESPPPYSIAKTMKLQQTENSDIKSQQLATSSSIHPSTSLELTCRKCMIKESNNLTLCSACKTNVLMAQK